MTGSMWILKAVALILMAVQGLTAPVIEDGEPRAREKRGDDVNPLEATVAQLSQQLTQLQAQVQANRNDLDRTVGQTVAFSVRMRAVDVTGYGLHQVVRFDNVIYNAGSGYSPTSGVFTAPAPGTYVFFMQVMHHGNDDLKIFLDIMKNGAFLARAHAGWTAYENGSTMAVTNLNQGDTIRVEVAEGSQFWGGEYSTFAGFRVASQ